MMKKVKHKIILSMALLITIFSNIMPVSKAVRLSGEINIYGVGFNKNLLMYNNKNQITSLDMYMNEGEEYPAYNALYPTYAYNNPYEEELLDENSFEWQVTAHGYPYKGIQELGCKTFEEAYTATQSAIYCAYCGHEESDYSAIEGNEASERTYNAFKNILKEARTNPITINKNNVLKLINEQNEWQVYNESGEYVYRTYHIVTNYDIENYTVELDNFEGAILKNEEDEVTNEFESGKSFKVMLPISKLKESGELEIKITTDIETFPIYLGTSPYNKYIMAAPRYEKDTKTFSQTYQENLTSVNVDIKELDTKIGIENSIVKLLNSNKELVSNLTSNEQGKIFIEHLIPGTYYIEQTATEEGYNIYKKQIELKMDYNKVLNLTINNAPINIENIFSKEENIVITEEIIEKNINNEIKDVNINNKTEIINKDSTNNEHVENNNVTENNVNNNNTSTHINNNTNTTNENNTNNEHVENNNVTQNNVNNNNTSTHIDNTTNTTNENNTNKEHIENNNVTENNVNNNNSSTHIDNITNTTNENNTNKEHVENNNVTENNVNNNNTGTHISNSASNSTNYTSNNVKTISTVKKLPKTGM